MPASAVTRYLYAEDELRVFMIRVLSQTGISVEDASISAEVLLSADMRGVESHGIIRLFPYYYHRLRDGLVNPVPCLRVVAETPAALTIDADNGLGHPSAYRAMQACIEKARQSGVALVTVRNSNHYGIAGYYAMQALPEDMIGLSFTNAGALVAPTHGRTAMLGTNPIAVAVPAGEELPYVLDMATSIVPIGKITVYQKAGLAIPPGWGIDSTGQVTTAPTQVLEGGALLPLGGLDEMRGYKGYGLALFVDILCGVLAGSAFGLAIDPGGPDDISRIGHTFAAIRIDAFRPLAEFKRDMDALIRELKSAPKATGQERIFIAGEKEFEMAALSRRQGVPVLAQTVEMLQDEGNQAGVPFDLAPLGTLHEAAQ